MIETIILIIYFSLIILMATIPLRKYLPKWYTCELFGWHSDVEITSTGFNTTGVCTKCKKNVIQDSQANWF